MIHSIDPVFDQHSRILILGSFPSVKSRVSGFYYGNPQNRFWAVLSSVLGCEIPHENESKKKILLDHRIALWDVIKSCDLIGSNDASIENVIPNDIQSIIKASLITTIYANGNKAYEYYNKYIYPKTKIPIILLPSTSPANAQMTYEKLLKIWAPYLLQDICQINQKIL
jgi:hypoxanthine-DNA glycosylase